MADVAAAASVSVTTVSLALRGHQRISPPTKRRVMEAAKELGYRVNVHASVMASRRFRDRANVEGSLVAVISSASDRKFGPGILFQLAAIEQRASELGYSFEHHCVPPGRSWRPLLNRLYARGCEGIILGRVFPQSPVADLDWSPFSVVARGGESSNVPVHRVRSNHFQAAKGLVEIARSLGYRRIGPATMAHEPIIEDDESRLGGVRAAQSLLGPGPVELPPFLGGFQDRDGFEDWLRRNEPDCVLAFHPGIHAWVERTHGTAFACFVLNGINPGTYSGMLEQTARISRAAVDLLDSQIRYQQKGLPEDPHDILIPAVFSKGATLKPVRPLRRSTRRVTPSRIPV